MIYGKGIMLDALNTSKEKLSSILRLSKMELDTQTKWICIFEFRELKEMAKLKVKRIDLFENSSIRLLRAGEVKNLEFDVFVYNGDIFKPDSKSKINDDDILLYLVTSLISYFAQKTTDLKLNDTTNMQIIDEIAICVLNSKPKENFKTVYERLKNEGHKFSYINEYSINILKS